MTENERGKLNKLYNRMVINCGIFIMSDEWYEKTSYEKACLEFNRRINRVREIEKYLYTPCNLGYYDMIGNTDSVFCDYVSKLKFTNNLIGVPKVVTMEDKLETKENKLNNIKKMLPLTEEEFDNIEAGTYAYYLSELDSTYKFTRLEKLYLMEYMLLKCELKGGK